MTDEAPRGRRRRLIGIGVGVAAGAVFAASLYIAAQSIQPASGMLLLSVLLIPPAASALAVLVYGLRRDSTESASGIAAIVVTALLIGGGLIFHEGLICLVMAAPIFYPLGIVGGIAAKYARGPSSAGRLSAALLVLAPALLMPVERQEAYPTIEAVVITSIEIEAPIDDVWRQAVEIREIKAKEQSWTITHDLLRVPRPTDARLVRIAGGLLRDARWAGGIQFFEEITDWRDGQHVAWRFRIPAAAADRLLDEHLRLDEGYLQLQSGRYDFEALSPTRTRLTLTTRYATRTPLNAYARAWGALLLGDIHRNVLHVVRGRAEAAQS